MHLQTHHPQHDDNIVKQKFLHPYEPMFSYHPEDLERRQRSDNVQDDAGGLSNEESDDNDDVNLSDPDDDMDSSSEIFNVDFESISYRCDLCKFSLAEG